MFVLIWLFWGWLREKSFYLVVWPCLLLVVIGKLKLDLNDLR